MHDQRPAAREIHEQVLGAAAQAEDAAAPNRAAETDPVQRLAQGGVPHPHADDPLRRQQRLQAAPQDLHLGQLGHLVTLSRSRPVDGSSDPSPAPGIGDWEVLLTNPTG